MFYDCCNIQISNAAMLLQMFGANCLVLIRAHGKSILINQSSARQKMDVAFNINDLHRSQHSLL